MGPSSDEHPQVLVAAEAASTMATLMSALSECGVETDVVESLGQARETFLSRGGHCLLLLGPDLTPATARKVIASLTEVDPDLSVAVFGDELLRDDELTRRIRHHPSSRAAVGAVLKVLQQL